jgi:hypothetical protein
LFPNPAEGEVREEKNTAGVFRFLMPDANFPDPRSTDLVAFSVHPPNPRLACRRIRQIPDEAGTNPIIAKIADVKKNKNPKIGSDTAAFELFDPGYQVLEFRIRDTDLSLDTVDLIE